MPEKRLILVESIPINAYHPGAPGEHLLGFDEADVHELRHPFRGQFVHRPDVPEPCGMDTWDRKWVAPQTPPSPRLYDEMQFEQAPILEDWWLIKMIDEHCWIFGVGTSCKRGEMASKAEQR